MMLYELTKETFKPMVLENKNLVLVDFFAAWCESCLALETILEDISDDFYGQLNIYKLNVENETELTDQFEVFNLPTLLLFENGQVIKTLTGIQSEKTIKDWLNL